MAGRGIVRVINMMLWCLTENWHKQPLEIPPVSANLIVVCMHEHGKTVFEFAAAILFTL